MSLASRYEKEGVLGDIVLEDIITTVTFRDVLIASGIPNLKEIPTKYLITLRFYTKLFTIQIFSGQIKKMFARTYFSSSSFNR